MATPLLRALRRRYDDATILGVIKPHVAPTLDGSPWLDGLIPFHPKSRDRSQRTYGVVSRLRSEKADLAVLLPNSFRSAALAWLASIPRRVGYARGGRDMMLTDRLVPPREPDGRRAITPMVDYYNAIGRHLGVRIDSPRLELFTTDADEAAADRAWLDLALPPREFGRVVCLNTGGAFGPAKNWPVDHFAALARRLADEARVSVLVVCGPAERDNARAIADRADRPAVVSLADQDLSIGLTKACVRRSTLLVTTDSGPRHFAAAFGVPVLTLFGPTHIGWTRTQHPHALHILHPVPCGPCQRPVCPEIHHRCMVDLAPDAVFAGAMRLLGISTSSPQSHPETSSIVHTLSDESAA